MDGQCEITINGKTVGLKFNRYAIEQQQSLKGAGLYKNIVGLVWGGIQGYVFAKQIDSPVTFEEVLDWIEEQELGDDDKEFQKITEAFQTSLLYKKLVSKKEDEAQEETEPDEEKKSNTLMKSGSYLQAS